MAFQEKQAFLKTYKTMADTENVPAEETAPDTNGNKPEEATKVDEPIVAEKTEDDSPTEENGSQLSKLERDIIRQIEYYFGDVNMRRDKFLIQKVAENDDGWVPITVLLTFNRLRSISDDAQAIANAVEKSSVGLVQLSDDRTMLRRHPDNPLPEFNESRRKELQGRTAYAKGFPLTATMSELIEYFNSNFEKVQNVIMRKYFCPKTKKYLFKGSVFVTFAEKQLAEDFVKKEGIKYLDKDLLRYTQVHYYEVKKQERSNDEKKKHSKKANAAAERQEDELKLPKAAVIHFEGIEGEITREDIKKRIAEIEPSLDVSFVHFNKGDKQGDLRFSKENDGTKLLEKLDDGKVKKFILNCLLT